MRRPTTQCLDCQHPLDPAYQYCPKCGQENNDQQVGLKTLLGDFLSNYFALDSKLGRSVRHFFLRPGFLTLRFNEGKRVRYIHPMRLYLVISVLFFFVLSYLLTFRLQDASLRAFSRKQSLQTEVNTALAAQTKAHSIPPEAKEAFDLDHKDYDLGNGDFMQALGLMSNDALTDEMVMDSLKVEPATRSSTTFNLFFHQIRKVARKDLDMFIPYVLKNLPIMMFILLPVFAAYLMFLFRNKPNLYIRHIIHALHLHSFAFLLLTLFLLIGWTMESYFFWTTFGLITLYAFLSVKKVYKQPWLRTAFKFLFLGFLYFNTLLVSVLLEMTWSLFTF